MLFVRLLLLPFSLLYGLAVALRNKLYDWKVFPSQSFSVPVIGVGNLTVGGTGKSPHVEFLIRLLRPTHGVATLSRGYKRKTKGFRLAKNTCTALDIGDEPCQFKSKYPDITVAVDGNRKRGINKVLKHHPDLDVILLDDAYQHRKVKPGLSILLIDYSTIDESDYPLPSGNLREWKSGMNRADIIIITKTPSIFSPIEKRRISEKMTFLPHQALYFSYINYKETKPMTQYAKKINELEEFKLADYKVLLFTGIANDTLLHDYLRDNARSYESISFSDHHHFSVADLVRIQNAFEDLQGKKKIIITTEKDASRLNSPEFRPLLDRLPVFTLPIEVKFHYEEEDHFNQQIIDYIGKDKASN